MAEFRPFLITLATHFPINLLATFPMHPGIQDSDLVFIRLLNIQETRVGSLHAQTSLQSFKYRKASLRLQNDKGFFDTFWYEELACVSLYNNFQTPCIFSFVPYIYRCIRARIGRRRDRKEYIILEAINTIFEQCFSHISTIRQMTLNRGVRE